jgi:ribonuclease HI
MPLKDTSIAVYIDGGARGNPGPAGGGFAVFKNGKLAHKGSEYFGERTNNQAEYLALRLALREVYEKFGDGDTQVNCFMDSQLVVEQMKGNYRVKSENVRPLFQEVRRIADQFKDFSISHVPREENALADNLANQAMDRQY